MRELKSASNPVVFYGISTGFIFEEFNVAYFLKRFRDKIDECASREIKLPPHRFDLGSLDLKADTLPIELAGPGSIMPLKLKQICDLSMMAKFPFLQMIEFINGPA